MENQKAKVVIYTKDHCPFCVNAKEFLRSQGIKFQEVTLENNPQEIEKIKAQTGWRTFPLILINNDLVGGYTDLKSLHEQNRLSSMIQSN